MKKNKLAAFTIVLYALFTIATIISLTIAYKDIEGDVAFRFVVAYLLFAFFLIIYIPIITIYNSRVLKRYEIRKYLFRFAVLSVLFGTLNCIFDYIFRHEDMSLTRTLSTALGVAFGVVFTDIIFLRKSKKNS